MGLGLEPLSLESKAGVEYHINLLHLEIISVYFQIRTKLNLCYMSSISMTRVVCDAKGSN